MANIKSVTMSCLVAAALATLPALSASADEPSSRVPVQLTQGQVTYMSGGIGSDEAQAMRGEESRFPLSLEFIRHADPRDQYLAGVFVEIKDAQGNTALNAIADGPILLATLPDGLLN